MNVDIMLNSRSNTIVDFLGTGFPLGMEYSVEEHACWDSLRLQIAQNFPHERNILISLTWFGPQFTNPGWQTLLDYEADRVTYDNVFFLATVDPPYLNDTELRLVKNKLKALRVFYLGNFDSTHSFNFFAPILAKKFKTYAESDLILSDIRYLFVNYNRKPKPHRVEFVKKLMTQNLLTSGTVTLGSDAPDGLLLSIGEKEEDYLAYGNSRNHWGQFGVPHDMFSLHRMDIWQHAFLYINATTEFNPVNDLFCQQDTFKPMLGLRPFVINGVQRTYRWLRIHGFKTFNQYWAHIDIEHGDVHDTIIELIKYLQAMDKHNITAMYQEMLPDLKYNRERFFEFAQEQKHKMERLFQ
jgi:hypothetical protein